MSTTQLPSVHCCRIPRRLRAMFSHILLIAVALVSRPSVLAQTSCPDGPSFVCSSGYPVCSSNGTYGCFQTRV